MCVLVDDLTPPFVWAWCQRQERKRYARGRQLVGRGRASCWARTGSYGSERLMRKERKQLTLVVVYFAKGTQSSLPALMKYWILLLCELGQDLDVEIIPANLALARPALRRSTTTCRHTIYHIANTSATAM